MKPVIYAAENSDYHKHEKEHAKLARKICADGIVLLENNGILPIKPCKISLYGAGARHTVFGGTGSGENNPRYTVNIEDGLLNAGFKIVNNIWLDEYDFIYKSEYASYRKFISKKLKKVPLMEKMDYTADNPFYLPAGRKLYENETVHSDTAIYVLSRQSGEGADRKDIQGDYYVTDDELHLMHSITKNHKNTILVLNVGAVIDLSFLDQMEFAAVVLLMHGGMEAGNALADILTGQVNPSGRLADTWSHSYSYYPCADTFSERNPDKFQEDYKEGIFAGYRWFDKKHIEPRYPFGYGLSYTSFITEYVDTTVSGSVITVNVRVTNTGKVSGSEVVLLYMSFSEYRLIREEKSLVAFAKTDILKPGEETTIQLFFDITSSAGFDNERHEFILEKGRYILSLNDKDVCALELDKDVVTEICKPMFAQDRKVALFHNERSAEKASDLPCFMIDSSAIKTIRHNYQTPAMVRNEQIDKIMSSLSLKEKATLLVGRTYLGPYRHRIFGAVGYTTSKLYNKGIDGMAMADGPQGLNLTKISKAPVHNLFAIPTQPAAIRGTHKILKLDTATDKDGDRNTYYQHCTSWPCETMIAQTFDTGLAERQGEAIGDEMRLYGVAFWLAPAVNIHRNPLCGRNFEYYSEDPILTGKMAAAVIKGVQSHPGCFATVKHFAANNLETKRNKSSSNLDERTLREIYLKAFRICVEEANVKSVMCSYNKLNGVYTALSYELQTEVLRNEWGFDGIVMTDWFATGHDESRDELCCKAGTDLIMPGIPGIVHKIMRAYRKGLITADDIERSARRIVRLTLESHTSNN